ncbi:aldehyde ferredoxin oxidoreductase family protein [Caldivirga sp. UBA161]|uniref:aldehyde ferredoxin oxidoreductase family protein n=1 Tax=Caldivirga sp. UBA161 TaxID=1915569 RepID=UPI0025BEF3FD|nr:aldehyde ferredoxin oxidoreductase C-terminal domain-containing protein [Caldivirga sp. UBA161]
MLGYTNRIARVNLSIGKVSIEETPGWLIDTFIGGKGFVYGILSREVKPGTNPLSSDNKIIVAAGALAGLAPASAKTIVGAVSPLSGLIHDTSVGEWFSYMLRGAGFDALIIEGASKEPVYLWVNKGKVEIRDASRIWGLTTREATRAVREETNRAASVMVIGPAGENLVKISNIMVEGERAGGRGGLGAVFGSKKLKAIAAHGVPDIKVADPNGFLNAALEIYRRFQTSPNTSESREFGTTNGLMYSGSIGTAPAFNYSRPKLEEGLARKLTGAHFKELGLEVNFPQKPIKIIGALCPVKCSRWFKIPGEEDYVKPEYETLGLVGSATGVFDERYFLKANRLVNDLGLDAIGAGNVIGWAMELYEKGLLTKEDTGGVELKFGNGEALIKMIEDIAYQRGLGKVLAQGVADAAEILGKGAEYAVHFKKIALPAWYPNGPLRGLVISYLTADVGGSHLRGWPQMHDPGTPLKNTVESMISDRDRKVAMDSMGLCVFNPYSVDDMVKLYNLATGRNVNGEYVLRVSTRIDTIARIWHVLLGYIDVWSQVPRKMIVDEEGPKYKREEIEEAIREFYRLRGWDTETGLPAHEYLRQLGIEWMIPYRDEAERVLRQYTPKK